MNIFVLRAPVNLDWRSLTLRTSLFEETMFKDLVLLSMREAPMDDSLESMNKTKLNDSEQLETTFALCNQDTVQQNESIRYTHAWRIWSKGTWIR